MKNRKTAIWVFVGVFLISIITLIIINMNSNPQVEGWNGFKKAAINNYTFIKDVNINSITPLDIRINYTLSKKIDLEEVNNVFLMTKNYILSEKVFEDLQKYHAKKYKYSFGRIKIIYTYGDNNDSFECKIFSSQDVDGEPNYNNFNTWYIEYNNEPAKMYNPILK
ncbi:hypothetical protein DFR58_1444 [Anaerobacterium chartisolvens]|uniref:Uncharacterized protein n=1 Tax=Anaerobacterium chartisolvens TaxID=1297424 RepID=A0A369AIR8_9FIRM|nr:hypothetical protein [Anaerobacterium chartisolvens]RCX08176.1 hypothetical protein DFR58_1444 [Anaerobacterium chartisolvens]